MKILNLKVVKSLAFLTAPLVAIFFALAVQKSTPAVASSELNEALATPTPGASNTIAFNGWNIRHIMQTNPPSGTRKHDITVYFDWDLKGDTSATIKLYGNGTSANSTDVTSESGSAQIFHVDQVVADDSGIDDLELRITDLGYTFDTDQVQVSAPVSTGIDIDTTYVVHGAGSNDEVVFLVTARNANTPTQDLKCFVKRTNEANYHTIPDETDALLGSSGIYWGSTFRRIYSVTKSHYTGGFNMRCELWNTSTNTLNSYDTATVSHP